MPTIMSTAMFATFKSNGDSEPSSPSTKRNFFVRSSSQSSNGSRSTTSTSSTSTVSSFRGTRVAIGDLSKVRKDDDDDFCYHNNSDGLDMENWKSFHRRFGTKPKKPCRRYLSDSQGVAFLRSQSRRSASRKDGSSQEDSNSETDPNLWSSMVHAVKGCTSPMWEHASAPVGDDEWLNEVPSHQRDGILDIRQENGKWYFLEEASTATDAVEYQLTE